MNAAAVLNACMLGSNIRWHYAIGPNNTRILYVVTSLHIMLLYLQPKALLKFIITSLLLNALKLRTERLYIRLTTDI